MSRSNTNIVASSSPTSGVANAVEPKRVHRDAPPSLATVSPEIRDFEPPTSKSHLTVADPYESPEDESEAPISALYPQVYDSGSAPGQVRALIQRSFDQADDALHAFDDGSLAELSNNFSLISVFLNEAFSVANFNDALASIIDYMRRAILICGASEVTREQLNSLVMVLSSLTRSPLISLAEAALHRRTLSKTGWTGDDQRVRAFLLQYFSTDDNKNDQLDKLKDFFEISFNS